MIREWGAVWNQEKDRPIAQIRDIERPTGLGDSDFRVWAASYWQGDEPPAGLDAHSKGGCTKEKPCCKCNTNAEKWWYEWPRVRGVK